MAIITTIPGLEVTVTVQGQALEEFPLKGMTDTKNVANRYIAEPTVASQFAITCYRDTKTTWPGCSGRVRIFLKSKQFLVGNIQPSGERYTWSNGNEGYAFQFFPCAVDSDARLSQALLPEDFGEIKIVFESVSRDGELVGSSRHVTPPTQSISASTAQDMVRKGFSYDIGSRPPPVTNQTLNYPFGRGRLATFIFRCRSKAFLRSLGYAIQTPFFSFQNTLYMQLEGELEAEKKKYADLQVRFSNFRADTLSKNVEITTELSARVKDQDADLHEKEVMIKNMRLELARKDKERPGIKDDQGSPTYDAQSEIQTVAIKQEPTGDNSTPAFRGGKREHHSPDHEHARAQPKRVKTENTSGSDAKNAPEFTVLDDDDHEVVKIEDV